MFDKILSSDSQSDNNRNHNNIHSVIFNWPEEAGFSYLSWWQVEKLAWPVWKRSLQPGIRTAQERVTWISTRKQLAWPITESRKTTALVVVAVVDQNEQWLLRAYAGFWVFEKQCELAQHCNTAGFANILSFSGQLLYCNTSNVFKKNYNRQIYQR